MDGGTTCQGQGDTFHPASGKESRVVAAKAACPGARSGGEGRLSGRPVGARLIIAAVRRQSEQEAFSERHL